MKYIYKQNPGAFKGELLMDDILAAHPELITGQGEARRCLLHIETTRDGSAVLVTVPDAFDKAALDALVAAHDPAQLSSAEQAEVKRARLAQRLNNTDLADIAFNADEIANDINNTDTDLALLAEQVAALTRAIGQLAAAQGYTPLIDEEGL